MAYYVPQVMISQEFTQISAFTLSPLPALVIGLSANTGGVTVETGVMSSISDIADVATTLGTVAPNNPVAQGVYNALLNSNGTTVYYVALASEGTYSGSKASGTLTTDNTNVADGETVVIGSKTYTFKTALTPTEGQVLIGASAADSMQNLIDAINRKSPSTKDGVKYKIAAANTQVTSESSVNGGAFTVTARTAGTAGNSIGTTETSSHLAWAASTLLGGTASTTSLTDWEEAIKLAEKAKYYGIVPVFSADASANLRGVINAQIVGHVEAMSANTKAKWRAAWFSSPVGEGEITGVNVDDYIAHLGSSAAAHPRRFHNVFPGTYTIGETDYDGCFIAAALAGLRSGSVPHQSLTNTEVNLGGIALLNDVVNTYSETVLDALAEAGCWILTQDVLGGTCYTRHQITAEGAGSEANLNYQEDSITANVDSISYRLQSALEPFKGKYNISPAAVLKVRAAIDNVLIDCATNTWTERAGNQLISYKILKIAQSTDLKDKLEAKVQLEVPYPMNAIDLVLSI